MASNRRSQAGAVRWGPLLSGVVLCAFFCAAGMGYVWHRNRNEQLSREITVLRLRLEQLRAANLVLDRQLEELRSPRALDAAVRRWNLGLVMPQPEQILRIREGQPGAALTSSVPMQLAARAARAATP